MYRGGVLLNQLWLLIVVVRSQGSELESWFPSTKRIFELPKEISVGAWTGQTIFIAGSGRGLTEDKAGFIVRAHNLFRVSGSV